MKKFEGVLICTDLDGTLLRNDKTISAENLKAIDYFKQMGGLFTFVTGRLPYYVNDMAEKVKINAPYGCVNGGGLYDFINRKYIWQADMPAQVVTLIKYIDDMFENIGIQVCCYEKTYFCKDNDAMKNFRKATGLENLFCNYTEIKEPIGKIIFGSENEDEITKVKDALNNHPLADEFDFVRSERTLYEILPKGITKGTSINKLCECLDIDRNKTIAIGDYNNDIPMFNAAKVGIAVKNACDEALKAADFITVSNEEDAVATVIYNLEKYLKEVQK